MLETIWLLKNHVLSSCGVGDLHSLEASSPLLVRLARLERFRKNATALVVHPPARGVVHLHARCYNQTKIAAAMAGLRFV